MTIRHVVLWKLAAEDEAVRAEHTDRMVAGLSALLGVVPSIRALSVGPNVAYPETNADLGLVADFDDLAGLEEYLVHPAHQEQVAFIRSVVAGRMAVDFEV